MKIRFFRAFSTCVFMVTFFVSGTYAAKIVRGPYVENPSYDFAVLKWKTDEPSMAWIEYGPYPECSKYMTLTYSGTEHSESLHALPPGTNICYRVFLPVDDDEHSILAGEGTFRTLKHNVENGLSFLVFGGLNESEEDRYKLGNQMRMYDPDFLLYTGNLSESGRDTEVDDTYFKPFHQILKKTAAFIALGSHDYGWKYEIKNSREFFRDNYSKHHSMPWSEGSPQYYSFDTANATFICLDANSLEGHKQAPDIDAKSKQIQWLKKTLSKSSSRWKFVLINYPIYSSSERSISKELRENLAPIFEMYGVDIVFQGYHKNYERTYPIRKDDKALKGGVIYTVFGGESVPFFGGTSESRWWSDEYIKKYGFANVKIDGRILTMEVYDKDGELIDELKISK
jgi:Calcineurin-like phosphoesterase